jgi:P27 family predicted phage terminase small subunit
LFLGFVALLEGMGLASSADTHALAMLSSRIEEIEICTAVIEDCGRTYTTTATSGDKLVRGRPEVGMRNEAMRHAQSLLAEFGLTPATRSKVSAQSAADNQFAALEYGF